MTRTVSVLLLLTAAAGFVACTDDGPVNEIRVSGYVEATEVQVAPEVGGRIVQLPVVEGQRVAAGDVLARLDPTDIELALQRARAERRAGDAQWRLLAAGARIEDIRQAEAQRAAAEADLGAARRDLAAAERDLERFEALMTAQAGVQKQRDDAAARRDVGRERVKAADERVRGAAEAVVRLRAGARREELEVAQARVAVVDAQIATLEKSLEDAIVVAPIDGTVTQTIADAGELAVARVPMVVLTDLGSLWANVYVDEPHIPRITLGQAVTLHTDAGGEPIEGTIAHIAAKAEFTPKNVQTADERSKLVFRLKIAVKSGTDVLKPGMPVEARIALK